MLKQSLQYKLLQKLSPQQIQLMKLIQLPTQAFEERIKQEIEENPALDNGKEEIEAIDDDLSNEFEERENEKNEDNRRLGDASAHSFMWDRKRARGSRKRKP